MTNTSNTIRIVILVIIGVSYLLFLYIKILTDIFKNYFQTKFRKQLKQAICLGHLVNSDLQLLAERWFQDRRQVLISLRILIVDSLSGADKELVEHIDKLRELLTFHQTHEPFADLPENIRLQLGTIGELIPQHSALIAQLASSLGDIYSSNQHQLKRERQKTFWSIIIGVSSLLLTIWTIFFSR